MTREHVALVTGAANGIGLAAAAHLWDADVDALLGAVGERFGRLDALVAVAGLPVAGPVETLSLGRER